ncbi:MAG: hypothetical protein GQ564_21305 [Bacteroidales bacterium]|nr:hypothetical protein [Bacteroidales bacterium]
MKKSYRNLISKIIVWTGIAFAMFAVTSYFVSTEEAFKGAVLHATFFMAIVLTNEFWLFPKFYMSDRRNFIIYNIFTSITFAFILLLLEHVFERHEPEKARDLPFIFPILRALVMVLFVDFISITILLANALKVNAENEKMLKEEKLGTEIKLLKAQINPHFIFNALNNIYSLTYTKSEMAPESVLKLSEMLRYVFYDCSKDDVKLGAEVEYISNFIAFQQMKSEHEQSISFDNTKVSTGIDIAPMLFIPFIENAFKYSKVEEFDKAYVNINLSSEKNTLLLEIENSIPESGKILSGNGLGIKNVRQRLDLLYPNRYDLDINDEENKFTVKLKITLK